MRQQLDFHFARVGETSAVSHEKIAHHALAAFIHEKAVAEYAAAFDCGVSGKNFRVDVAQDHLRRPVVIPGEQTAPGPRLIVEQGTQVNRRKMPEVENLHGAPASSAA